MSRLITKHVAPARRRFYGLCGLLLLFVASVVVGIKLALVKTQQGELLPFMLGQQVEKTPAKPTLSGAYLASRFAKAKQDYDAAADYAQQAIALDDANMQLRQRSLRLMVAANALSQAQAQAKALLEAGQLNDALAIELHVGQLLQQQDYAKAQEWLQKAPKRGMLQLIRPVMLGWLSTGEALKAADAASKQAVTGFKGANLQGFLGPFMQYQRGLMNDLLGFEAEALDAYKAASANASLTPYRVVQAVAGFYWRQGKMQEALKLYSDYALHHPQSELPIATNAAELEQQVGGTMLVGNAQEGIAEVYFTAASLLFGERAGIEAMVYLRLALALKPNFPAAQMMLASLFEQQGKHDEAVKLYGEIDRESQHFKRGRVRIALNYRAAEQSDTAIELLNQMVRENPTDEGAWNAMGDIYRYDEAYQQSAATFKRALKAVPKQQWSWLFYFKYGMALERSKQWDAAEKQFEQALALKPEQPDVLNYLGYSWLERKVHTDRAMRYIRSAYEQEPNAAHIIDSMGWAYYLTGNYPKAVELLEEAVSLAPQDPTINDHLGDAYWRVGRKQEAQFQWNRALVFKPDNPSDIHTKLEQGLAALPDATL